MYLLFGICGGLLYLSFSHDPYMVAVGASGAISGIMGGYFVLYPHAKVKTLFMYRVVNISAVGYIGFWILMQIVFAVYYQQMNITSDIGWFAHIGGFFAGIILFLPIKWIRLKVKPKPV